MEIRIEEEMTGRERRDRIISKYGSRERLEALATEDAPAVIRDDLWTLELLEKDTSRLDSVFQLETIIHLDPDELQQFTGKRLQLLEAMAASDEPLNVTELAARVGRDKKNVSEDLQLLADLGLIERERRGREKVAWPRANEIRIVLDPSRASDEDAMAADG